MARGGLAGAGTQTLALAFGGAVDTPVGVASTESWNGTNWTNENDLNTSRNSISRSGTQTSALAFGGSIPPATGATEEWYGDGKVTDIIQSS